MKQKEAQKAKSEFCAMLQESAQAPIAARMYLDYKTHLRDFVFQKAELVISDARLDEMLLQGLIRQSPMRNLDLMVQAIDAWGQKHPDQAYDTQAMAQRLIAMQFIDRDAARGR